MLASHLLFTLALVLLRWQESGAWSYSASSHNMSFDEASAYCQEHYTHLVAIQNQAEIQHLNALFSHNPTYYWIGIRKVNDTWTWIGTQKALTPEATNWAPGEPNNKRRNEDCVEIYIKRERDAGMWNDELCSKKKLALCYTAACTADSCSGHGECVETINNYTCRCYPGFSGLTCEQVVTCPAPEVPEHGSLDCSHPWGHFSYESSCQLTCARGYQPSTPEAQRCLASGEWSTPRPTCQVVDCETLAQPPHGFMDCSPVPGLFSWNTTCSFGCEDGFELVGDSLLQCSSSGTWDHERPTCRAVTCSALGPPGNGSVSCTHAPAGDFTSQTSCKFTCAPGFRLQGSDLVQCTTLGHWTQPAPVCEALQCPALSSPERGHMRCLPGASGSFQSGSSCEFSCQPGYTLRGPSKLWCGPTGQWNGQVPTCQATKCSTVHLPPGGAVTCSHAAAGEFTSGTLCTFSCQEGLTLLGASQLSCSAQGQWSHAVPSCQAVQCPSLHVPGKVDASCNGDPVPGTACNFTCPEGWMLNGSAVLTCGARGQWSGTVPTCEALEVSSTPLAVGLSAAGTSLLGGSSFLLWLLKRLRKKAKKFVPASSCQSLESDGSYQMASELI
ncbi:E-selectin [Sorex fumeus]|uniref:E-selectin n=1 Tax=Sorex fumeus TaxID=62283 RepID=UPI0024AD822D|nr:E-selectin [Sorex fumeus]